jgi:hypothetical protein
MIHYMHITINKLSIALPVHMPTYQCSLMPSLDVSVHLFSLYGVLKRMLKTPTSRNRTSDLRITTQLYSPPLYQLSYGRL